MGVLGYQKSALDCNDRPRLLFQHRPYSEQDSLKLNETEIAAVVEAVLGVVDGPRLWGVSPLSDSHWQHISVMRKQSLHLHPIPSEIYMVFSGYVISHRRQISFKIRQHPKTRSDVGQASAQLHRQGISWTTQKRRIGFHSTGSSQAGFAQTSSSSSYLTYGT